VPPSSQPSPAAGPSTTGTALVVSGTDGTGRSYRWSLTCDPPGGDHPTPVEACRVLAEHGATALPPVGKDRACTQVYGGSETATVSGTWRGATVLSSFKRTNGCEIGRWNALVGLLPRAGS
jgi:hypothetical protein